MLVEGFFVTVQEKLKTTQNKFKNNIFFQKQQLGNHFLSLDKILFKEFAIKLFLPPASERWGKVIFSVRPHLQGGTPSQV